MPINTRGGSASGGTGALVAGVGVKPAGTGGVSAAGIGASGIGVAMAGTGAVSGTGGPVAGMGAAEMYSSCATADKVTPGPMLNKAASAAIIVQMGTCTFSSCHTASVHKAKLVLDGSTGMELHALTVGKPSCEAPALNLVDSSGGDKALANSWLWQKLIAPSTSDGALTTKPEWGAPVNCGQISGQAFGHRMPDSSTATLLEPGSKLISIRDWICAGAP
jgi:hypothetical protein